MESGLTRRSFVKTLGAAALSVPILNRCSLKHEQPNILWLTSEDNSPLLGCYGDEFADTPNFDKFAQESILYENAFANAPVCAPARSTIITGMYACSMGTHNMRSQNPIPPQIRFFTQYLRDAGYYCSNNSKEDYNTIKPEGTWDESSTEATFEKRGEGQPFFAVFNYFVSHESSLHKWEETVHDPAKVTLPPYHPDTPEARHDWAQYYDKITELDRQIGEKLAKLDELGLAEDTIVFYYADHGGVVTRSKRFLYDTGTKVPMMVRFPEKYRHLAPSGPGSRTDRLVSFVDLAPTVLSLAGVRVPEIMQGEAFLGPQAEKERDYVYLFRGRMDERYDMMRAVRDKQFKYIRNYMPHRIYGQHLDYLWRMPTTRSWEKLHNEGKLNKVQDIFWNEKPKEELYDTQTDPWEVNNLANDPQYIETLQRLRGALNDWVLEVGDPGYLPEAEMVDRAKGRTVYELGQDKTVYDQARIMDILDVINDRDEKNLPQLVAWLSDPDNAVRFWAADGCLSLGVKAAPAHDALMKALDDETPNVRVAAAEALLKFSNEQKAWDTILAALDDDDEWVRLQAANALDYQDKKARRYLSVMKKKLDDPVGYIQRVMEKAIADIQA